MQYECVKFVPGLTVGGTYREELDIRHKYNACIINDDGERQMVQRLNILVVIPTKLYRPEPRRYRKLEVVTNYQARKRIEELQELTNLG